MTDRERLAAGRDALYWHRVLDKSRSNVVREVLSRHGDRFLEWNHYPPGDVLDRDSQSQWYYHAHPKQERPGEHGHFHTFRRVDGGTVHLVAVSMDRFGQAIQLFTTNRWVTGESWAPHGRAAKLLETFDVELADPSWPTNRWLTSLLRFYRPTIAALLRERDAAIAQRRRRTGSKDIFEDRELEVTSAAAINLGDDVKRLEGELGPGRAARKA